MNRDFIASAIGRVQTARYAKRPSFGAEVEQALKEAVSQPFGDPLAVARVHSYSPMSSRRAVWGEVVRRLEAEPQLAPKRVWPPVQRRDFKPEDASAGEFEYSVGPLTDVGPGSPGALLNELAAGGRATVRVLWAEPGSPFLLYSVEPGAVVPGLEILRHRPAAAVAAE